MYITSSVSNDKSKKSKPEADRSQESGIAHPSIPVEKPLPKLPHEGSFRHKLKEGLQIIFSVQPSHSHAASIGPSEGLEGESWEYLSGLDTTAYPHVGDKNPFLGIKNDLGKPSDRRMRPVDRASDLSVNLRMSTLDEIAEQTYQDSIQESNRQAQVKRTIGGGVSRVKFQQLDKGKGRDNQAQGLSATVGLAMSGHRHQGYQNSRAPEADNRPISRNQFPGGPSEQEAADISTQPGVASHLHGAHHFTIGGNPRFENIGVKNEYTNCANHAGTYDITILKEFVSFRAFHDSSAQDPTRCVHPGTRRYVLKRIRDWIDTPGAKERIFWLHGPAGVGKSAIAQTIAHSCARGKLTGTFFFYRSDPGRNDGNRLFSTLAWQFSHSIPAFKNGLIHTLIECPDICTKAVETQFEELIVKPFLALKSSGVQLSAPVVIIDAVDECSDDSLQQRFLKIIGNAVKDDCVSLRFLICSRPEAHIQDMVDIFGSLTLPLDLAKLDDANQDIEIYLKAEFSRIVSEQGLDPAWPGKQIIQELVYKASGQFIYASTVIKYVGDKYSSAETQLDIIRGLKPPSSISPFAELDELYKEILRRQRDPVFLKDFLSLLIGRNGIRLKDLHKDDGMLMNVSEMELHRKLRGMRSLLKSEPYIDFHHRSFLDFLQDSSRSGEYHISQQAGTRRYLDFIACSLVRYASTVMDGHDNHKTHFSPQFHKLSSCYPAKIVLPVEEWQQVLQPLVDLQNKLLTLPNFRCIWEFQPCKECTGCQTIRDLLLHLAFLLGASDRVLDSALMAETHADGFEEVHSIVMPTETDVNGFETDLNACLSSLLPRLRRRMLGISLGTETVLSLLHFDHAEIAMKLKSISDAQNLVDLLDELLINNKYLFSGYSPDILCKTAHLVLEIYTRVPVLPRSLFTNLGIVGPHHDVWPTSRDRPPEVELMFQTAFMSKILDPSYVVRVLWVYEHCGLMSVVSGKGNELLSQWRERSKPSSVTRIRVMLEVAKAIRYFHSMGLVLHRYVDSDDIFLDSEFHARFRFLGLTAHYVNMTPRGSLTQDRHSHEANIFLFGCLFYEMCFDVKISFHDRVANNSNAVAKRFWKPEIRDDAWQLIQRCCTKELTTRPTMDEVVQEMEGWDISLYL